jgi:hypothetical protein
MDNTKFNPLSNFRPKTPRVLGEIESNEIKVRGLGDVIARATSAVGIKPCGGCQKRREALNKLIPFNTNEQESTSDGTN